jgi:hypothetical protein
MNSTRKRITASRGSVADLNGTQAGKVLIVEPRNQKLQRYSWDEVAKERFQLSEVEVDQLDHGAVLWRGSTAFIVERQT